jgi:hypothetical protein
VVAVSAELVAVVIFDEVLFKPGGQVHRWMTLVCRHFEEHAQRFAPVRSGELREGIHSEAHPFGLRQMQGTIASEAPHTMYVLKGTTGPIMATKMWNNPGGAYSKLWGSWPKGGKFTRKRVAGEERRQYSVPNKGYWLAVGKQRLYPPTLIRGSVSGQEANNFLFDAWRATARTHPSLRGLAPAAAITF